VREKHCWLAGNQPAEQGQSGRFKGWCWCPLSNYSRTFTVSLNAVAAHEEAFLAMSGTNRPCIGGLVYFQNISQKNTRFFVTSNLWTYIWSIKYR
jgi:hypothetical protein